MSSVKIFYFHTLDLTFKSAQTIQIIKDYKYLSKNGIEVSIYGTYKCDKDYLSINEYLNNSKVNLVARKHSSLNKVILKFLFLLNLLRSTSNKILITRHHKKLKTALKLKKFGLRVQIFHEMHEECFPYLFKKKISKKETQSLFFNHGIDLIIFTNYSQKEFFIKEFGSLPKSSSVLPNGVEIDKFCNICMESNFVLTYGGGFNDWKNLDIIFESLSVLDKKYTLKIAGGKGNSKSENYVKNLIDKYSIDPSRVNYLGFVDNHNFPYKVLSDSNVLLLPLGDNIQSRYLTSPMKLFEYMATQIPVLAIDMPSVSGIAEDSVFFSKLDSKDFADAIVDICNRKKSSFDFSRMNSVAEKYSYKNRSSKFLKEIYDAF